MVISEVFSNPTVKHVIFQIRFPNLFYIENRIGDFQLKIMKDFPKSALLYQKQIVFADIGPKGKLESIETDKEEDSGKKIWQFTSTKEIELNVSSSSLDINSQYHKTYNLGKEDKFRDTIKFVLDQFFEVTQIPIISRVGLRYIDECPIPSKDNTTFRAYYNSVFPVDRFNIAYASQMAFRTVIKKDKHYLSYLESLQKKGDEYKLILDFDSFAEEIPVKECLEVTDKLHDIISDEYEKTIKKPVYEYMRQRKGG